MRSLFLLLFLILAFTAGSQSKKVKSLFVEAEKQYEDSLYAAANQTYWKIRKLSNARSDAYARATYNIACTYTALHKTDSAINIFGEIIESDFNETAAGGLGSGIMADPYTLYKHNACLNLVDIYFEQRKYSEALKYIKLSDYTYPYRHFCGNELEASAIYLASMYSTAYCGIGDTASALKKLLPNIFETGLASNGYLVDSTVKILKKLYSTTFLKSELEKAVSSMYSKKQNGYNQYFIKFLGTEIQLPYEYSLVEIATDQAKEKEMERRKQAIKTGRFYSSL